MSPVALLRSLPARDYLTLLTVTGFICAALGFAGAAVVIVYGPWQGAKPAPAGVVTDGLHLTRGDP